MNQDLTEAKATKRGCRILKSSFPSLPSVKDSLLSLPDMKTPECAIGLDVGGTKIAAGLVAPDGKIIARRVIPTLPQRGGEAVLEDALSLASSLREEAGAAERRLVAIGVGVGELVDLDGNVASAQTIPWRGVPVR